MARSRPAAGQAKIDFGDGARMEAYLRRCGLSRVAAAFTRLIIERGQVTKCDETTYVELEIGKRPAAEAVDCSGTAILKAVDRLVELGLLTVMSCGRRRRYVLDFVRARSLEVGTAAEQLTGDAGPVVTRWTPTGHPVDTPPLVLGEDPYKTTAPSLVPGPRAGDQPVTHECPTGDPRVPNRCPVDGNSWQSSVFGPELAESLAQRRGLRTVLPMPWLADNADSTSRDIVDAVRGDDLVKLAHLYAEAVSMGGVAPSEETWRRFLTIAHVSATHPKINNPRGRLLAGVKNGLDIQWCRDQDEDWAVEMLRRRWRVPGLERRMVGR